MEYLRGMKRQHPGHTAASGALSPPVSENFPEVRSLLHVGEHT